MGVDSCLYLVGDIPDEEVVRAQVFLWPVWPLKWGLQSDELQSWLSWLWADGTQFAEVDCGGERHHLAMTHNWPRMARAIGLLQTFFPDATVMYGNDTNIPEDGRWEEATDEWLGRRWAAWREWKEWKATP